MSSIGPPDDIRAPAEEHQDAPDALLEFRPVHIAGRPAVEIHGPPDVLDGLYAALHAALDAAETPDDAVVNAVGASVGAEQDGAPPLPPAVAPGSVVLCLDRSATGIPRVRRTATAEDDLRRLSQAELVGGVGSWELLVPSATLRWSENLFRIYGLDPQGPAPTLEDVFALMHPDDRVRAAAEVDEMRRRGSMSRPMTHRIVRPSGEVRHLQATLGVVEVDADGTPRRFVGSVQDVTERRRAEQAIATHLAVAEGLAEWEGLEPSAQRLLRRLSKAMGGVGGVLWVPDGGHLVARVVWPAPAAPLAAFWRATRRTRLRPGVCAPGRAWERREPVFLSGGSRTDHGPRWRAVEDDGVRGMVAIPALNGTDVVAVVELPFLDATQMTPWLLRSLTGVGHELGQFFGRRLGELAAASLTARELEVLHLASQGMTTRATAEVLFVSPATVKTHLANIYEKLEVTDRAAAVGSALRLGIIR